MTTQEMQNEITAVVRAIGKTDELGRPRLELDLNKCHAQWVSYPDNDDEPQIEVLEELMIHQNGKLVCFWNEGSDFFDTLPEERQEDICQKVIAWAQEIMES